MTESKPTIQPDWDEVEGAYIGDGQTAATRKSFIRAVRKRHLEGAIVQFPDTDIYVPETLKQKPH
jgi:hypothetical protein